MLHECLISPLAAIPTSIISTEQLALLAGLVGVTVILLVRARRKLRSAANDPRTYVKELRSRVREEHEAVSDVEKVMRELDELSRQIHGRIDTRFAKLEAVIRDADRRIETLTRLVRDGQGTAALDTVCGDAPPAGRVREGILAPAVLPEPQGQVCRLAEAGLTPPQIAAELGRSVGEVELILSLQKTRLQAASATPPSAAVS